MNKKSTFRSVANNYLTHPIKEAGITLVALVVTIIVLLILAGIALGTILGQDGLIQRAKDVTAAWENASTNESAKMAEISSKIDEYINTPSGPVYWGNGENKKEAGIYIHSTGELIVTWENMNKVGRWDETWDENCWADSGDIYDLSGGVYCAIEWYDNIWLTDDSTVDGGYVLTGLWKDEDSPNYDSNYYFDLVLPEGIVAFTRCAFSTGTYYQCSGLNSIYLPSTFKGIMDDGSWQADFEFAYYCSRVYCLQPAPYYEYFEELREEWEEYELYIDTEFIYVNDN